MVTGRTSSGRAGRPAGNVPDIAKGAVGSANVITGAICRATDDQPAKVCNAKAVQQAAAALPSS